VNPPVVVKRPDAPKVNPPVVVKRPDAPKVNPPVVVKRPDAPKTSQPSNNLNKPIVRDRDINPPKVVSPPARKPLVGSSNGLVKSGPAINRPVDSLSVSPTPDRQPRAGGGGKSIRRAGGAVIGAAAAPDPVVFNQDVTFDSGLDRSNGLVLPVYEQSYRDHSYGYSHYVSPSRHRSYVSYSGGYCAPIHPYGGYYSSPYYGSSVIYSSYDPFYSSRYYVPCPPTYINPCGPTYYTPAYCPPTYYAPSYRDSWNVSFGISSSSSWFGVNYGSSWSCPPYYAGSYIYRAAPCYDPCGPRYGWWRRPVWGWTTYSCDPWSYAEPRGPVYPFETTEYTGAIGLTQAAALDATAEFEEAVYSTMRGNYQTAINATRHAVLGAPESFGPGQSDLDRYQLQRATWALTVYENPPRAVVNDKDAAFMVAAISALSGDHESALQAATEARDLGDDHPATLELIQRLAMDDARADWGVQNTMR